VGVTDCNWDDDDVTAAEKAQLAWDKAVASMSRQDALAVNLIDVRRTVKKIERKQNGMARTLEKHDRRFDSMDRRFDAMDHRFDAMDHRFAAMDNRFDAMDHKFDAMDNRFDAMEAKVDRILAKLDA
jgi:predicted  nucleic acid-binding Zn-ribbon protein